jgi:hypothetical protein
MPEKLVDDIPIVKGAFIQIMRLTWDSFLLPVMDRHPWLTIRLAPHRVCGEARYPRLECLRLKNRALRGVSDKPEPLRPCVVGKRTDL